MIKLLVIEGPDKGLKANIDRLPAKLGRKSDCQLRFHNDTYIPRSHAEIYRSGSGLFYRHLSARSGSIVESMGKQISLGVLYPKCRIRQGDKVRIGESEILIEHADSLTGYEDECYESGAMDSVSILEGGSSKLSSYADSLVQFLNVEDLDLTDFRQVHAALLRAFLEEFQSMDNAVLRASRTGRRRGGGDAIRRNE